MSSAPQLTNHIDGTDIDPATPTGAWLRLPCCDHSVHPVRVVSHDDGVMVVSAPMAPHEEWVKRPTDSTMVALGWTDDEGSTVLECRVIPEHHLREGDTWALEVVSASNFVQRRKHRRVRTDAKGHLLDEFGNEPVAVEVLDISEGGMKLSFTDFVPTQRDTPMRFALQVDGAVLIVLASLRWSGRVSPVEVHAGFEFDAMHEALETRVRAHVIKQLDRRP